MKLDAIPVFKPNQALTADHLNDLRKFLDYEDRLTRRALIGIGVMCGFKLDVDADANVLISKGVAVTSEGHLIAEEAVVCDRHVPYEVPIPSGEDIPPEQVAEARYPFLFPDGETQIDAWEMLTTEAEVPDGETPPSDITAAFLSDKTVMLFLECTEESLKNCDINDCSDKGAELQYVLRRLLVKRADADAMMAQEAAVAGIPTDLASHPGLDLKYLRVEDLGIARNGIGTYPALFARILQITARLSADLPQALRDAYGAYNYLLADMYPVESFPEGPFPDAYFGNLWGNLATQPFLAQYFYDYLLDAAMAYNAFVDKARAFECVCLPNAGRFPKHVLLGDPVAAAAGFVAGVTTPAEFAAYDPLSATTGFGPSPRPPRRRTPWTPACAGHEREDLRALFHRLTLLAHSFQLRGLLQEQIRITPSRHDAAPLSQRCIPPYYAFTRQSDLFRVWSPEKTRANLLSTVYAHQFSTRNMEHPYLYRVDGETFHAVAGHVGKNLAQAMGELIVHKRVLGLDFAIEPVWMGLALADDAEGRKVDEATRQRALQAAQKIIMCRMGDFEVILLTLLAALFAFLVFILRGAGRQLAADHAKMSRLRQDPTGGTGGGTTAGREMAAKDMARLAAMVRMDALRRPDVATFAAQRLDPKERRENSEASKKLLGEFRRKMPEKGQATKELVRDAGDTSIAGIYLSVKDEADGGSLFERVRARMGRLQIGTDNPEAVDRVYNAVALMEATEELMTRASVPSLAQLDGPRLEAAYVNFSDRLEDYAKTAPTDPEEVDRTTAAANMAMIDYSSAVAAQATTFSSAGLLGEAQRRILAIFQDLTLEGFARRNPGLEHRAGVPRGGTLVLAYASKAELAALMERAGPRLDKLAETLKLTRIGGSFAASLPEAAKEVLSVAGGSSNDPLSDFVVLADFCLPSKCCDADCSDIVLDGALPEGIFDLKGSGRMAVDPIIPNGIPPGQRPGNIPIRDELSKMLDGIGVRPGNFESRRPILKREEPAEPDEPSRPDQPERPREPDQPDQPDEPADRQPGVVAGRITGAGNLASTPVPNAVLVAGDLRTGASTRISVAARTGAFKTRLAAGKYRFSAKAEGFESTSLDVAVEPGSEQEIALRMKKAR